MKKMLIYISLIISLTLPLNIKAIDKGTVSIGFNRTACIEIVEDQEGIFSYNTPVFNETTQSWDISLGGGTNQVAFYSIKAFYTGTTFPNITAKITNLDSLPSAITFSHYLTSNIAPIGGYHVNSDPINSENAVTIFKNVGMYKYGSGTGGVYLSANPIYNFNESLDALNGTIEITFTLSSN